MDTTARGPAPRGAGPLADAAIVLVPASGPPARERRWTDDDDAAPGVID
jgi:hypothetical protein